MSSFVGLDIGLSGIRASQTGIDGASDNDVANAITPGYVHERNLANVRDATGWLDTADSNLHTARDRMIRGVRGVGRKEGHGDAITRRGSGSELVRIDVTASEWLGFGDGEDLSTQLDGLVGDLRDGTSRDLNARLDDLRAASNRIGDAMSRIGPATNRLDPARDRAESQALTVRTELSSVQDVDVAEGVLELQIQQGAYEATLQALARALPPSLVSFLR